MSIMNEDSALSSKANFPLNKTNLDPDIFTPVLKSSCFSFSPISTWSRGSKENLGFVPHSLINLFSFSLSPSGTSSSKLFGNTFKISFSSLENIFIS